MDLGIKGRTAIVSAASKGLGRACAMSLAREGVAVTISSRSKERIEAAAKDIRDATGAKVTAIVADVATEEGRAAVLKACPDPDILINNAGGPPHGDFRQFTYEDWIKALDSNMLSAIFMIKGTVDGMIARKFGRIVNITSRGVKSPILNLPMSNGARAGLTGFCGGLARQTVLHNVTINALLPGSVLTDRVRGAIEDEVKKVGTSYAEVEKARVAGIPAGRLGTPEEFGDACAYLCSAQSGYITGQNLLIDGGAYSGTL